MGLLSGHPFRPGYFIPDTKDGISDQPHDDRRLQGI